MKFLFTLLAFLLLYMSCLPCGDSNECNVKAAVEVSATEDHQEHNHDSETCTPFCTCSCCAVSVYSSPFYKIQVNVVFPFSQKHLLQNVDFDAEAHYSIWEPPQLMS